MNNKILGFNQDAVYAAIIILILIILGVITFHYYAFVTAGDKSAFSAGFGAGFKLMPVHTKENLEGQGIVAATQETLVNAKHDFCVNNKCSKDNCTTRCKIVGCPCQ